MSYGTFKSVAEVARKFNLTVKEKPIIGKKEIKIAASSFAEIKGKLGDGMSFINEVTICETIIRPILNLLEAHYVSLRIWSHVPYNVDHQQGLVGEPDYLIAPRTQYGDMATPPLCIIEAKQEKFDEGWAQALAEMVAASSQGAKISYGVVTTGKTWEFGRLQASLFNKDPYQASAVIKLQEVFEILNWLFAAANASIENNSELYSGE